MKTEAAWQVFSADWQTWHHSLATVRRRVFIEEQGVPEAMEWDEHDTTARHILALSRQQIPIGSARLLDTGQIGRMAVLPEWRHQGIGQQLLKVTLKMAQAQGLNTLFLHAQIQAASFYQPFGFVIQGEPFTEAGITHVKMYRKQSS